VLETRDLVKCYRIGSETMHVDLSIDAGEFVAVWPKWLGRVHATGPHRRLSDAQSCPGHRRGTRHRNIFREGHANHLLNVVGIIVIPGIDGTLETVQTNEETPILQLHDLQGNIVGTIKDLETETKLLTKYNSTEYGVPSGKEAPPKYAWLGAAELPSGSSHKTGSPMSPQAGRPLRTESTPYPAIVNIPQTIRSMGRLAIR
jgi:hypothetical protein